MDLTAAQVEAAVRRVLADDEPKKKGKATWRPAAMLDLAKKDPNYRYRWCDKDTANIIKKQSEGWEFTDQEHVHPEGVDDGHPLTSTTEYRELVLMRLPKEIAEARDAYFQEKVDQYERSVMRNAKGDIKKLNPEAQPYGKIVIE